MFTSNHWTPTLASIVSAGRVIWQCVKWGESHPPPNSGVWTATPSASWPPQSTFSLLGGQRTQQDSAEPISLIQPHPCVDSLKPHLVVRTQQVGAKPNLHTEWLPLPKNAGHEPWKWVWRKVLRNNLWHCDSTSGTVSGHWKFVWRVKSALLLGLDPCPSCRRDLDLLTLPGEMR